MMTFARGFKDKKNQRAKKSNKKNLNILHFCKCLQFFSLHGDISQKGLILQLSY